MCEQVSLENMPAKVERIRYWDIVKGITIIAVILGYTVGILGSIVIIELSRLLDKINLVAAFFAWAGKNSMIILAVHCLEMMFFNWSDNFYMRGGDLFAWIPRFIFRTVLILMISMIYVKAKSVVDWMNEEDVTQQTE